MNPSPQVENGPQSAALISTVVVVNFIWWMVMIAAIGVGAMHLNSCPVQPMIPIYLMVMGAASLLSLSLTYIASTSNGGAVSILSSACMTLLHIFTFCWFIAGSCWIYSVYPPSYTEGKRWYCEKTTFQFAFVVTTLTWVILSLVFVCGCCFAALTCCKAVRAGRRWITPRYSFYGATRDFYEPIGEGV